MVQARIVDKDDKVYLCPEFSGIENKFYEIIRADDLYEMIHEGIPLSINGVCVEGFSMADYRKKYMLPDDDIVDVWYNMITNCLFCARDGIVMDFSYCCIYRCI